MTDPIRNQAEPAAPKFTPGPWRWEVSLKDRRVQLCGGDPKGGFGAYDHTVMDFVRWGMSGAQPRFLDREKLLIEASELTELVDGREHHEAWFRTLSHPDARLIAAAPDLFCALIKVRAIIVEAALTGFNCHEGDWAERLFASQADSAAAVRKACPGAERTSVTPVTTEQKQKPKSAGA